MGTHEPGGHPLTFFQKAVLIAGDREAVFDSLATLQHVPRWSPEREHEDGPGSFEITGYEPPHRLTLAGHIGRFEAVVGYFLDELALGTLVTCSVQVDLTDLFLKGDVRRATSRVDAAVSRGLERTKELHEAENAT